MSAGPRIARRIATAIGTRRWATWAGEVELQIPTIRQGSYFPSFLERAGAWSRRCWRSSSRRYFCGVSTRRVDRLVESLGLGVSRSEGSRICAAVGEHGRDPQGPPQKRGEPVWGFGNRGRGGRFLGRG